MKTANEMEKDFLHGLEKHYGHDLDYWMDRIVETGFNKLTDIQKWLKAEKGFKHTHAWMLAAIFINDGKPVYGDEDELLRNQMAKFDNMRPLLEFVSDRILKTISGSEREVKKTYVSFKKKREFAVIVVKSNEIRLGLDLGDMPFDDQVQKAKLNGPMERISHMVVLNSKDDFTEKTIQLLKASNARVNS